VEIRPARGDEARALADVQEAASVAGLSHIFPSHLYPFPRDAVLERWTEMLADPDASVLVAERDDAVLGLAAVRPEWLDGLYVRPEAWGDGVGRRLHDEAVSLLQSWGHARCHLWVLEHNDRARRFYERLGWRENGDTRVVPFAPNPIDVGYTLDLESRMARS
jgi:GNAT superfamily N-acetyltransferase